MSGKKTYGVDQREQWPVYVLNEMGESGDPDDWAYTLELSPEEYADYGAAVAAFRRWQERIQVILFGSVNYTPPG